MCLLQPLNSKVFTESHFKTSELSLFTWLILKKELIILSHRHFYIVKNRKPLSQSNPTHPSLSLLLCFPDLQLFDWAPECDLCPLSWGPHNPAWAIPDAQGSSFIQSCVLHKAWKALFPPLAWVTAERHVSSDERKRVSLRRIWLTLSDSSVPGQFRHTDIKHIKCLSQHFTWHCSSTLICYPPDEPASVAASSLGSGFVMSREERGTVRKYMKRKTT